MNHLKIKKLRTLSIVLVIIFSLVVIINTDLVDEVKAQSFSISTNADFDSGSFFWTSTSSTRYNQSDNSLEMDFPHATKDAVSDGLVSYWRLDTNSATQPDETPQGNDGTVSGATYNATGKFSGAYDFAGGASTDNIDLGKDASLDVVDGTYSIAFWMNARGVTASADYLFIGQVKTDLYLGTNYKLNWYFDEDAGHGITSVSALATYTWYHVVLTCATTRATIYLNGTQDITTNNVAWDCARGIAPTTDWYLGRPLANYVFNGVIDEFKIYNRTLSSSEAHEHYNGGHQYAYPDFPTPIQIDDNSSYTNVDYDPQLYSNSRNDYVAVYGPPTKTNRVSAKYSTDNGLTWSSRTVLVSNSTQLDGIIDKDIGAAWEISGVVYNDILYLTIQVMSPLESIIFTKCNIENVSNIETYSNWQSMDGTPVPSSGNGADGAGYDKLTHPSASIVDSSIVVRSESSILVGAGAPSSSSTFFMYWDGSSWNPGNASVPETAKHHPRVRLMNGGDWVVTVTIEAADTNDYDVIIRCNASADVTDWTSWTSFDGLSSFDYVIDTGAGGWGWGQVYVDNNNYVHVISLSEYLVSGVPVSYHNYWNGTAWVNGNSENSAGSIIQNVAGTEPRIVTSNERALNFNADIGGLTVLYTVSQGPDNKGTGVYSLKWSSTTEAWEWHTYQRESSTYSNIVNSGQLKGIQVHSTFMTGGTYYIAVDNITSGTPWWDSGAETTTNNFGWWESSTITMTTGYYLNSFTITYSNISSSSYIGRIYFKEAGLITAEYTTDITSGTSTTITTATKGSLSDIDTDWTFRIYLMSDGTTTPTIASIYGYYLAGNTAPTIDNCPSSNIQIYRGRTPDYQFEGSDADGDTLTWSISVTPVVNGEWLDIGSSSGILSGTTGILGSYTFTISVEDPSAATDTCSITIEVLNLPEEPIKYPPPPIFDFECVQTSGKELMCWCSHHGLIPEEKLTFTWNIDGETHTGKQVVHRFAKDFQMGDSIWVTLTLSYTDNPTISKDISKNISSNYIPIWIWLLLILIFGFIILFLAFREVKEKKVVRRASSKLKAVVKSVGWTGALLLGAALVWLPTGTPEDVPTTLLLISVFGLKVWMLVGIAIIIACIIVLGKKLIKVYKYGF